MKTLAESAVELKGTAPADDRSVATGALKRDGGPIAGALGAEVD